ncbi:4a-hydroxytetrahydrobiopterin dehydratase [Pleionea sp. CnH1-48]|uniref:4a-hydroxytetrahydrobiopterin dehydratase n=1 Tax=Pleionea sp. CnH1-48 TaxID=2954494 RepID=UPI002096D0C7|nr:4a-hydroxytetrahydrobiopterin dehydratase [Pleionea sp. CnH1-48]MCO7224871.1 4a-hydroxytetrahydrobiopterin dehydratase [Pleionea sp. CnH1-48]
MTALVDQKCRYNDEGKAPVPEATAQEYMQQLAGWVMNEAGNEISREFLFKNYYHTMNFVNAIAWIANKEAHHPDMEVNYGRCLVKFTTHDIGNSLSINDFITAAKVNALLDAGDFGPKLVEPENN